jgi:hypothetical protein
MSTHGVKEAKKAKNLERASKVSIPSWTKFAVD